VPMAMVVLCLCVWPRLLLCVRGKERQLSVALLCKVVNDLLGWILDIGLCLAKRAMRERDLTSLKHLHRS
jgi:hypothetical protein